MTFFKIFWEGISEKLSLYGLYEYAYAFVIAAIIFIPLERAFLAKKQKIFRPDWGKDLAFFTGQIFIWNALSLACLISLQGWIEQYLGQWNFSQSIRSQAVWLQFIELIVLCDLGIYWGHRLSHKYKFLWRFHKTHHTAERLDWLAAYREHPLDNIYTRVIENLPALLLGFPLEYIAGFILFRGMWGLFIHSNCQINLGWLEYIIGSPRLHHWHHEKEMGGKCNFANLSPLMDLAFGTFHRPKVEPEEYGYEGNTNPSYLKQIFKT